MSFSFPNINTSYFFRSANNNFGNGWNQGTFMAWVKFNTTTADCCICSVGPFNGSSPMLFFRDELSDGANPAANNTLTFLVNPGAIECRVVANTNSLNNNNWCHVVGTFNTTLANVNDRKPKTYIDGVLNVLGTIGNPAQNSTLSVTATYLTVGRSQGLEVDKQFFGNMEDFRVYNRSLSAAEIATIYHSRGKDTIVRGLVTRLMSNLGSSDIDVPSVVPDISPNTTNFTTFATASGNLKLSDDFVLSAKRPRVLKGY
jgi:hypothetical protein